MEEAQKDTRQTLALLLRKTQLGEVKIDRKMTRQSAEREGEEGFGQKCCRYLFETGQESERERERGSITSNSVLIQNPYRESEVGT